jgi:hypothetical protein
VHVPLTIVLVRRWGISGAAMAVAIRCAEDFVLYEWASRRAAGRYVATAGERSRDRTLLLSAIVLAAAFATGMAVLRASTAAAIVITVMGIAGYAWICWSRVLSPRERRAWAGMLFSVRRV